MKRFDLSLNLPRPSVEQVLWRSGCPPDKAGRAVRLSAENAIATTLHVSTDHWSGAVLLVPGERPAFLNDAFQGKPVSLMAVTLGTTFEKALEGSASLDRFMLDSSGSVVVEAYMKRLQSHLSEILELYPTQRIAPGYGSMPISMQREIIGMFPRSGITCGEGYMLSPVKSMTGVVGWVQQGN